MNSNFTFSEFIAELERQSKIAEDYLVPSKELNMCDDFSICWDGKAYRLNSVAHTQLASKLNIPKLYYDDMVIIPGLRAYNVNAWLKVRHDRNFVRILDKNVRAILSEYYKPLDHLFVLHAILPVIEGMGIQIVSCIITEQRIYMQGVVPGLQGEVSAGDIVQAGFTVTNSETGLGALGIRSLIWRSLCSNGLILESLVRKHHVGRRDEDYSVKLATYRRLIRNILAKALSESNFERQLTQIREAANIPIGDPLQSVERVTKRFNLSRVESDIITHHLVTGGDVSLWGLVNSITNTAKLLQDRDRQYELEIVGGRVLHGDY